MSKNVKKSEMSVKKIIKILCSVVLFFGASCATVWLLNLINGGIQTDEQSSGELKVVVSEAGSTKPRVTYTPTESEKCQPSEQDFRPYLISIPSANIENACIEYTSVGSEAKGQLDDPEDKWNFGWYVGSRVPEVEGEGVYTCHDGNGNPNNVIPAVCNDLKNVQIGDKITVEISSGQKFVYQVVHTADVLRTEVDMDEFRSVWGGAERGLSIMTCSGGYDTNGEREKRFLVFANFVSSD